MGFFKRIKTIRHLGPAGGGGSQSQTLASEDGCNYVVKFKENGQGLRVLVNELVANGIARFMGLPCPEGVIIEVDDDFLKASKINISGKQISSGLHFGTLDVTKGDYRRPPKSLIASANNKDIFPGIVVFDILTFNYDRNNEGNFLILEPAENAYVFHIIDHGHCFGQPNWDGTIINKIGTWNRNALDEVRTSIVGSDPFRPYIDKAKTLSNSIVSEIVAEVPNEWGLSSSDHAILIAFIQGQRDKIEEILSSHRDLFPNWK